MHGPKLECALHLLETYPHSALDTGNRMDTRRLNAFARQKKHFTQQNISCWRSDNIDLNWGHYLLKSNYVLKVSCHFFSTIFWCAKRSFWRPNACQMQWVSVLVPGSSLSSAVHSACSLYWTIKQINNLEPVTFVLCLVWIYENEPVAHFAIVQNISAILNWNLSHIVSIHIKML